MSFRLLCQKKATGLQFLQSRPFLSFKRVLTKTAFGVFQRAKFWVLKRIISFTKSFLYFKRAFLFQNGTFQIREAHICGFKMRSDGLYCVSEGLQMRYWLYKNDLHCVTKGRFLVLKRTQVCKSGVSKGKF
jgi:hypothetical protein